METDTTPHIASIQKNLDPDPQLSDYDESNLWGELEDCCESEERLNLYKDTFLLPSPYNATGKPPTVSHRVLLPSPYNATEKPPTVFHHVLVLPLEGPSLSEGQIEFDRSLRSRMATAKSLLQTLRDLHQAGFVHSDIALGNVVWKIDPTFIKDIPTFIKDITINPVKALGAPTERMRLLDGDGRKSGHRVVPVKFPCQHLGREVSLADFGILLPADKTTAQYKLQGTLEYIAPERFHGHNPSPASDMWSFMVIFVYLYLGERAFPNRSSCGGSPERYLYYTWENLGPLPAKWKTATPPVDGISYAPQSEAAGPDPPKTKFPSRLREDRTKAVAGRSVYHSAKAKSSGDADVIRTAKRLEEELRVKKEAETHALKVIHGVFRYEPSHRLTAEQLLVSPDWIKLMKLCGV
ncbi:hypothetical protein LA080_010082 [Diaporthe eres]|nr:hypothetical protein LA080_010082 [Diaporthe eres]